MKHYKHSLIAFFSLVVLGIPWLISAHPSSTEFIDGIFGYVGKNIGAVFFQETITVEDLQDKYDAVSKSKKQPKIRILIMPGHEPDFGGTSFGGLNERDIVVDLAQYLEGFLKNNKHYEVIMARDKTSWNPELENYFKENWDSIVAFVKESKSEMIRLMNDKSITKISDGVLHNDAPQNVALRLYGINKWNNENKIDMAIHIHFNDYPRRNMRVAGNYTGFSIYVPEKQYSNSTTTRAIAETIFKRLSKYNAISNLSKEDSGLVEEQDLIAIGSYNTLDAPSMLIEYGYIYEPQIIDPVARDATLKDLAFQTYLGIQDFFGSGNDVSLAYDTLMLPYNWKEDLNKESTNKTDILALQTALIIDGVYPPNYKTKNECPRTGKFGPCTVTALNIFQNKHGIKGEENVVGEQTKKILNNLYSARLR